MEQTEEDNRPKWLQELENRKRQPKLAHEIGAGSPCIKCNEQCPGLDLHFWRKICKNCKCSRDDHNIPDAEFPQFDLLFGSKNKPKNKPIVLKINQQAENETFDWVPPNTSEELAADYMKALPADKLPIKGSAGAALRKQQLQKQLPLHDIDHKACDELTESEKKQFENYVENLKNYVGQGRVSKLIIGAKPFEKTLMTPANASECFTPKHSAKLANSEPIKLRKPSSFIPKSAAGYPTSSDVLENTNPSQGLSGIPQPAQSHFDVLRHPSVLNPVSYNQHPGRYHHVIDNVKRTGVVLSSDSVPGTLNPLIPKNPHERCDQNKLTHETRKIQSDIFPGANPSGPANSTKVSGNGSSLNYAESESVRGKFNPAVNYAQSNFGSNDPVYDKLTGTNSLGPVNSIKISDNGRPLNYAESESVRGNFNPAINFAQSNFCNNDPIYENLPCLSQLRKVQGVQSEMPNIENSLQKSEQWSKQLGSPQFSKNDDLAEKILSDALLPPSAIHNPNIIGSSLGENELSLIREKLASKYSLKEEPVDASSPMRSRDFSSSDDKNHSVKPASVQLNNYRNPQNSMIRSETLHNPIFPEEAVGMSQIYDNQIPDNLESALDNLSINQKCHQCYEKINVGDVVVTAKQMKDSVWHPGCFTCSTCNQLLADLVYFCYKDNLYCGRDLAQLLNIPRCHACDELIFVRKYTVAEGHNYHVKHFCCWDCDLPLAGQQYISENNRPLCLPCYQKNYAKSCHTCNKIIAADQKGVVIKHLDFHATDECFSCVFCKKSLFNGKVAVKENQLLCSKECISKYFTSIK